MMRAGLPDIERSTDPLGMGGPAGLVGMGVAGWKLAQSGKGPGNPRLLCLQVRRL